MSRLFLLAIGLALWFGAGVIGAAPADPPRIGFLTLLPESGPDREGFRQGLRELGYVEGKNILIEWRQHGGAGQELRALTEALVNAKVDVIVASGTTAADAAMRATATIPVVFGSVGDPVASGFAASLARPGRNGTGVSIDSTELYPKRLEFLHQLAPKARRITYLVNSSNPIAAKMLEETEIAARTLSVRLQTLDARNAVELGAVLQTLSKNPPEAILVGGDLLYLANKGKVAAAVRKARVPAIFAYEDYHEHGALMSYGPSVREAARLAAGYIDKILKGAKPSELPIQQISRFELIIDLRLARELGIDVPRELLARADRVIK
ncbi:MAG: ABC transporter substrate-binding protein [Betaproteobacteria bacterium]|nr:ABC transporter substrate-binding protein [Betaproteobacteria bacterium]